MIEVHWHFFVGLALGLIFKINVQIGKKEKKEKKVKRNG